MLKKILYIMLFALLTTLNASAVEQMAQLAIKHVTYSDFNQVSFDLYLLRTSESWQYWANGTFDFQFDSTGYVIDSSRLDIELVPGTSDLDVSPITGELPITNYLITPRVIKDRFSITIAGPDEVSFSKSVPLDTNGIRIGQFTITSKDSSLPPKTFLWMQPQDYYQACAYKIDRDSAITPNENLYFANNNVEMDDGLTTTVDYTVENQPEPGMVVINFQAKYIGNKRVELTWQTLKEAYDRGFIITRTVRGYGAGSVESLDYKDTIADFRLGVPPNDALKGLGTSKIGQSYDFNSDSVPFRGYQYSYQLEYEDVFNKIHEKIAFATLQIPNSVILKAWADPNPFSAYTTVFFQLEDDVRLTATVYDLEGKKVTVLLDNIVEPMGVHSVVFNSPNYAQQGLYDIILVAYPIDDPTVDFSTAVVKTQLLR